MDSVGSTMREQHEQLEDLMDQMSNVQQAQKQFCMFGKPVLRRKVDAGLQQLMADARQQQADTMSQLYTDWNLPLDLVAAAAAAAADNQHDDDDDYDDEEEGQWREGDDIPGDAYGMEVEDGEVDADGVVMPQLGELAAAAAAAGGGDVAAAQVNWFDAAGLGEGVGGGGGEGAAGDGQPMFVFEQAAAAEGGKQQRNRGDKARGRKRNKKRGGEAVGFDWEQGAHVAE
jgi:hypothetical protein